MGIRFAYWTATLAALLLGFCGCASDDTGRARPVAASQRVEPERFKAVWVDTWGPGLFSEAQVDALVAWCRRHGVNTILAEVRKVGDAYYESEREPRGVVEPGGAELPGGFDPLGYLIDRAKGRGEPIRVEAWIVANRVWKGDGEPGPGRPEHLVNAHPEWLLVDSEGRTRSAGDDRSVYIDPSDPEARAHVAAVARDIVARYDVDGVHLDYIRYPGNTWGYGNRSLARYAEAGGRMSPPPAPDDPDFVRWRADQVTKMVREIRGAVRAEDPTVDLTAAVLTWGEMGPGGYEATRGYVDACQDWERWVRFGEIDVVYPMHYKREREDRWARDYRVWLDEFERLAERGVAKIVVGVGAYMNDLEGSRQQIVDAWARDLDGVCIFSYRVPNDGVADPEEFGRVFRRATR